MLSVRSPSHPRTKKCDLRRRAVGVSISNPSPYLDPAVVKTYQPALLFQKLRPTSGSDRPLLTLARGVPDKVYDVSAIGFSEQTGRLGKLHFRGVQILPHPVGC